jgi:hypothetical protein
MFNFINKMLNNCCAKFDKKNLTIKVEFLFFLKYYSNLSYATFILIVLNKKNH